MPDSPPDRSLVRLWRAGDQDAARQIFDRYVGQLLGLARLRISQRLARRVDPEDVVQSVFRTFFGHCKAGDFHVEDPDDLCKLLTRITIHKVLRQVAFNRAGKRDFAQEAGGGDEAREQLFAAIDREPAPDVAVAFLDQLEAFLDQLRPQDRQIIDLRLQGHKDVEIAQKLGTSTRQIRRLMERIRGVAAQEGGLFGDAPRPE